MSHVFIPKTGCPVASGDCFYFGRCLRGCKRSINEATPEEWDRAVREERMGMKSRTKGKVGEREIAALISEQTGWQVKRKVRQLDGESDLEGVPGWCVEVKRHATATRSKIREWWDQAVFQSRAAGKDEIPVLFFRRDRDEWRAVWPLSGFWEQYELTAEGSIEAWASEAREVIATGGQP